MNETNYRDKMFCCWQCAKARKCKEHECTIQWCCEFEKKPVKNGRDEVMVAQKPLNNKDFQVVKSGFQGIVLGEKTVA